MIVIGICSGSFAFEQAALRKFDFIVVERTKIHPLVLLSLIVFAVAAYSLLYYLWNCFPCSSVVKGSVDKRIR